MNSTNSTHNPQPTTHIPSPKLHAYLAHCGIASRRKAERMIEEGKVIVNGKTAHIGQRVNPQKDTVMVDGTPIKATEKLQYYLVYKPVGYVSTTADELGRRQVTQLVPSTERLFPVGRLDKESEGLLILTNDGELTYRLTHPKYNIQKTYHVLIKGIPSTPALNHLKRGVKLKEGYVEPISMNILGHEEQKNTWIEIVIDEGMNQQIRRMIRRIGYDILLLKRVKMGPFELGELKPKQWRKLHSKDIEQFFKNQIEGELK